MNVDEFLSTVYLGDRGCKAILIDGWRDRIALQIDTISRVRSSSGDWEYYDLEDIVDGMLVFTGVTSFCLSPSGPLPNDLIDLVSVAAEPVASGGPRLFRIRFSADSVNKMGERREIIIELVAEHVHLEDPSHPGLEITV